MCRVGDERIEDNDVVVGPIMRSQRSAVVNVAIAVAHVYANGIVLEIIAKYFVTIAIDAHALGIRHVIAIVITVVAVTLADFAAGTVAHSVVAIRVAGRLVGNHFVLAVAADEQIIFAKAIAS